MNKGIEKNFIKDLVKELNRENENRSYYDKPLLDVCYMVSVVEQNIEKCTEFMEDITNRKYDINSYEEDATGGYTNGSITIHVGDWRNDGCNTYVIEFYHDERPWGYCGCTPEDEGYNKKYGCCGMGCDWYAPAFTLVKRINLLDKSWDGEEKDFWIYKEKFEENESNTNKEVEEYIKNSRKETILKQITQLTEELENL